MQRFMILLSSTEQMLCSICRALTRRFIQDVKIRGFCVVNRVMRTSRARMGFSLFNSFLQYA